MLDCRSRVVFANSDLLQISLFTCLEFSLRCNTLLVLLNNHLIKILFFGHRSLTRNNTIATNICSKFFPAGSSYTVRSWLNRLIIDVPQVPSGDILTSIDNDQVLIKK